LIHSAVVLLGLMVGGTQCKIRPISSAYSVFRLFRITDCFKVVEVTDSTISILSNKKLTLILEKHTGHQTATQKRIRVGMNVLKDLEACTAYRLLGEDECSSASVVTLFRGNKNVRMFIYSSIYSHQNKLLG